MGEEKRAAVKVVKSSLVVPEIETPRRGLWLSNLDLAAMPDYTALLFVYRSNGDSGFFSREKLKTSLSKALVAFYPLAGRLVSGEDGRLEVSCNGEGVLFLEAEADSTVDEFGDFAPSMDMRKMLVPWVPSGNPPCLPLLLQVTSFRCGGATLGVALHHMVADGPAFFHFFGTWADISRGVSKLSPPVLDRGLLRARSPPKVLVEPPVYRLNDTQEPVPEEVKPFSAAMFVLSQDQTAALKVSSGVRLGTFKAVVAHVWRCLCEARGLAADQESRLHMLFDARNRLDPPLPKGFFGNAAFRMYMTARVGDVVSDPLERTANRIHEVTSGLGDEHMRSLVDFLELQEDLTKLTRLSQHVPATDLCAVSWLELPTNEAADFGWGRPFFVRRACLLRSGIVYIMHNPGEEGGVSLALSLETECMPAFQKAFFHGLEHSRSKM